MSGIHLIGHLNTSTALTLFIAPPYPVFLHPAGAPLPNPSFFKCLFHVYTTQRLYLIVNQTLSWSALLPLGSQIQSSAGEMPTHQPSAWIHTHEGLLVTRPTDAPWYSDTAISSRLGCKWCICFKEKCPLFGKLSPKWMKTRIIFLKLLFRGKALLCFSAVVFFAILLAG